MNTPNGRQVVLAARPNGNPKLTDFRVEETAIPTPTSGQILLRVEYLSLDPYMRGRMDDRKSYAKPLQIGDVMTGEGIARVIVSNRPDYSVILEKKFEGNEFRADSLHLARGGKLWFVRDLPGSTRDVPPLRDRIRQNEWSA
jgi:hypothetical protein